jgi:hypothetical protein
MSTLHAGHHRSSHDVVAILNVARADRRRAPQTVCVTLPDTGSRWWAVVALFVVGLTAAVVLVTATGPVLAPAAIATVVAPWLSHQLLHPTRR